MIFDLKTDDEEGRARALERYDVLDTGKEEPFENIVSLVQQILQVPICAVSLIDRHRQWFKACRGLDICETPREVSFCTHTIRQADPFIVNDATRHPVFRHNPLVTDEPKIRSYAGIPLRTPDGYNVGTLCAIDTKPRDFDGPGITILKNFAKIVVDELELRQAASRDGLTGVLTRRAWTAQADAEIERSKRYGRRLSLAIMDIDQFKAINDTYGHLAGDRVIRHLAEVVKYLMRRSDFLGRFGGEEFVLMMPEAGRPDALAAAERIRTTFADAAVNLGGGRALTCTTSLGISELSDSDTLDTLLGRADRALYDAKETGRNRTAVDGMPPANRPGRVPGKTEMTASD